MIQAREYDYEYYFEGTGKLEHIKLKVKKSRPVGVWTLDLSLFFFTEVINIFY